MQDEDIPFDRQNNDPAIVDNQSSLFLQTEI